MNLKWLLVRRITLVAVACFLIGSAIALYATAREMRLQNVELAELAGRQLDLQLSRIDRSTDLLERFPDWETITNYSLNPGQCLEYRGADGSLQRSSCAGIDASSTNAPWWFVEEYRLLVNDRLTASRPVSYRGVDHGSVVAAYDPVATAKQAWAAIAPLLVLSGAVVGALCIMTYLVVDRALRPAKEILSGLNRLAKGDLTPLPPFRLDELNRISDVFNALCQELRKATSDRTELARRLVDAQEKERRHIARELHDEIAQKLAAMNALAACIRASAQADAPGLVNEAKDLEKMASALMVSIRRTLTYLRPQEIDDLGLIQSLTALIEQHNELSKGKTVYSIQATDVLDRLRAETSAHVYRIVQEALTNASKHANARHVRVDLGQSHGAGEERIKLSVVDDGNGPSPEMRPSALSGSGLIGMRERVVALSGSFAAGPLPKGGFGLLVEFPFSPREV